MAIEIKELRIKDYNKVIQFAITGMHFNWYLDSKFLLNAYGRYFWYLEMNRATQILAAYDGDEFIGVMLAEVYGEERKHSVWYEKMYVRFVDVIQRLFFKGGAGLYEDTTKKMLKEYLKDNKPDGEIIFLAADLEAKVKGIGTALLNEFEKHEQGKKIFLYTDDACTYRFYEHRGFERAVERDIVLDMGNRTVPLKCFLFSKVIGG